MMRFFTGSQCFFQKRNISDLSVPLILILSILFHLINIDSGHNWGGDFASYLQQASCIVKGTFEPFMTQNSLTIFESDLQVGPVAYPWGYPLLLSPISLLAGNDLFLMKLPTLLCFLMFLSGLCFLFRNRLEKKDFLILLGLFAFNPILATHSNDINSDLAFLGFVYISLSLCRKCILSEIGRSNLVLCFITGFLIGYATMIRVNGLFLLPAFVLALGVQNFHRFRSALMQSSAAIAGTLLVIGSFLWIFPSGEASHVTLLFKNLSFSLLFDNIIYYGSEVWGSWILNTVGGYRLTGLIGAKAMKILCALFSITFMIPLFRGICKSFYRNRAETVLFASYSIMTLGLYIIWPATGVRFMYPLLALFTFWILYGLYDLSASVQKPVIMNCGRIVFYILIGTGLCLGIFRGARLRIQGNPLQCAPYTRESLLLYEYIRKNTPEDAVILFFKPRVMTLQTERRSLYIFRPQNLDKGDYCCYTNDPHDKSAALLQHKRLKECYRNDHFRLFRILKK